MASELPTSLIDTTISSSAMPKLLAISCGLLSSVLIVQGLLARRAAHPAQTAPATKEASLNHWRTAGLFLILVGYVALLPYAGYALSIAVLLFVVAWYRGGTFSLHTLAFAVVGAAVFYVLFVVLLNVRMPAGTWPAFLS
jgi:hypothetical protein